MHKWCDRNGGRGECEEKRSRFWFLVLGKTFDETGDASLKEEETGTLEDDMQENGNEKPNELDEENHVAYFCFFLMYHSYLVMSLNKLECFYTNRGWLVACVSCPVSLVQCLLSFAPNSITC
jgi:hypothetical protein